MIDHRAALRLAATQIDFPLSPRDEARLRGHLDTCGPCRRTASELVATARDLTTLAVRPADRRLRVAVSTAAAASSRRSLPSLRLGAPLGVSLGFAALLALALLALAAALGIVGAPRTPFVAVVAEPQTPRPSSAPVVEIARSIPTCAGARSLVAGAGALWLTCPDGSLWRASPAEAALTPVADGVQAVVPGTSTVWALAANHLVELDGASGRELRRLNGVGGAAGAIDGTTLVVLDTTRGILRRLATDHAIPAVVASNQVGSVPVGVAIGFGAAWVTLPESAEVVRVDLATNRVSTTINVGEGPRAIEVADGRVWVSDAGDGTVAVIDPKTNRASLVDIDRTSQSDVLSAIATGTGGRLWVVDMHGNRLIELDARDATRASDRPVPASGTVAAVAVLDGGVWLLDAGSSGDGAGAIDLIH
jgi:hypothetical protein